MVWWYTVNIGDILLIYGNIWLIMINGYDDILLIYGDILLI